MIETINNQPFYLIQKIMNLCLWFDVKVQKSIDTKILESIKHEIENSGTVSFSKKFKIKLNLYNHAKECIDDSFLSNEFDFFMKKLLIGDYIVSDCIDNKNNQKPDEVELSSNIFKQEKLQWISDHDKITLVPNFTTWKMSKSSCELESSIVNAYMNLLLGYFHRKISFLSSDLIHDFKKWLFHYKKDKNSIETQNSKTYMLAYIHSIDIENKNYVFYPFCDHGHWVLIVFDLKHQSMYCMNPLNIQPQIISSKSVNNNISIFKNEFINKPFQTIRNNKNIEVWAMDFPFESNFIPFQNIPKQMNTVDCGVMVCYYMRCLTLSRIEELNQFYKIWGNSFLFRKHMLLELNEKELLEK